MSRESKIGIVAILVAVIFVWGYNYLKGKNFLDGDTRYFTVEYRKIGGLTKSSFVTINGLKVGKVETINIDKRKEKRGHLIVRFSVKNDFEFSKNSIVRIYSPNPLSPSNLAIVPNYDGETAVTGDELKGEMEESLFTSIGERLNPLQQKIERVIVRADTLFSGVNKILNDKTINSINASVVNLSATINDLRNTIKNVNSLVSENQENLKVSLANTKRITENFATVSDSLSLINMNRVVKNAETAILNFNALAQKMNSGDGTISKLLNDTRMYDNLAAATKEMEELLRDIKLNPKRYIHFSIFGKKQKKFTPSSRDTIFVIQEK